MSISSKYEEIQQCLNNDKNREKYQKMRSKKETTKEENLFLMAIDNLEDCVKKLKTDGNFNEVESSLLITTSNMWIRRITQYLIDENWM